MRQLALRLPDSLHERVRALARRDNTSLNQFIALAVAEKVSALETVAHFFSERAARGNLANLNAILDRVPNAAPLAGDER
jgi:predicted transcriptional regulator